MWFVLVARIGELIRIYSYAVLMDVLFLPDFNFVSIPKLSVDLFCLIFHYDHCEIQDLKSLRKIGEKIIHVEMSHTDCMERQSSLFELVVRVKPTSHRLVESRHTPPHPAAFPGLLIIFLFKKLK